MQSSGLRDPPSYNARYGFTDGAQQAAIGRKGLTDGASRAKFYLIDRYLSLGSRKFACPCGTARRVKIGCITSAWPCSCDMKSISAKSIISYYGRAPFRQSRECDRSRPLDIRHPRVSLGSQNHTNDGNPSAVPSRAALGRC